MISGDKRKESREYVYTTLLGGFLVILPVAILFVVFSWVFNLIKSLLSPLTSLFTFGGSVSEFFASLIAIIILLLICFGVGLLIRTRMGNYLFEKFDQRVLSRIPLYRAISETVKQFTNRDKMPFSKVVLVDVFNNDTRMTGFITDEHQDDIFTIFVPTGPNPTNGFIFNVKKHQIKEVNIPVDEAMKTIIGVGTGSKKLMEAYTKSLIESKV